MDNQNFVIKNGALIKYNGPGGDVVIPEGVTKIKDTAFENCTGLTSVTIPESVTKIGQYAFLNCTGLTSVTILEGVTEIRDGAFSRCIRLTSMTLPKSVAKIGDEAFIDCTGLTSVTIPEGVTAIGGWAFCNCTSLTSVTFLEGVTEIGRGAFYNCTSLTSVILPKSVTKIDQSVFADCRPVLLAPHIPAADFAKEDRPGACRGFAKLYLENAELDEESRTGYLKYIKGQKKRLFPTAIQHEELLRLMFAEKIVTRKDIDLLLEECDKQNNITAKAAVLDYAGKNLKPIDPVKAFKLTDL